MLWFLPRFMAGVGELLGAVFVRYDPSLRAPGTSGYLALYWARLAALDFLDWFFLHGSGVIGVAVGVLLLLRRYRGPLWGGFDT